MPYTPKIQNDLLHILLRYRTYQYVLTSDIEKMYRQFLVREEDRAYQNILWLDTKGQLKEYQLNTVTFGLFAGPYLAIRCLKQLAQGEDTASLRSPRSCSGTSTWTTLSLALQQEGRHLLCEKNLHRFFKQPT